MEDLIQEYQDTITNLRSRREQLQAQLDTMRGKKVFYSQTLTQYGDNGERITPDDIMQQLFLQIGDSNINDEKPITEYNPQLRVLENKDGVQAHLDYLSFKCGFGTKHYQFNAGSIVTATQYTGDKQELIQNANKHYIVIERALKDVVKSILWVGKEILGLQVNPNAQVTITFDDGFVIDKELERQRDIQEVRDLIMQKWEYRVKWYGENEKKAKRMAGESMTDDKILYGNYE